VVVSSLSTAAFDGTGADRAVVAFISSAAAAGGGIPTGSTWDVASPEALSSLVTLASTYNRASLWGLANQTSATDTITVTWAVAQDEALLIGHSFTGVDTGGAFGNTQSGQGTAAEPSETLTGVGSDDLCLDGLHIDTAAAAAEGADQTLRGDESLGGAYPKHALSSTQPGSAGGGMTWAVTGGPQWVHVAVVIVGVAGVNPGDNAPTHRPRPIDQQNLYADGDEGRFNELDVRNWWRMRLA